MRQMMTAIAPLSINTQQQATTTPQRATAPQSLPSRIFEMEMEDTSQLTNALSGPQAQDATLKSEEDGVFSPPRISKKRQKSAPVESRSTEETQESTNESMEIGAPSFQEQEEATNLMASSTVNSRNTKIFRNVTRQLLIVNHSLFWGFPSSMQKNAKTEKVTQSITVPVGRAHAITVDVHRQCW
jgi:hypothetical protein